MGKCFLIVALISAGVHFWSAHQDSVHAREASLSADSIGFVPIVKSDTAPAGTALIIAAMHCSSQQAKRADQLAQQLSRMGIPNQRTDNYSYAAVKSRDLPLLKHTSMILAGEVPIVVIDGFAKANPSADDVAAEYRRSR